MKLQITKPCEVDAKLLKVYCGGRLDYERFDLGDENFEDLNELLDEYPMLRGEPNHTDELMLIIEVDTGLIRNWPLNHPCDFHTIKIVDEGTYILYDDKGAVIADYAGYVPECLGPGGYGDYFEFEIDDTSHITDWKFTQRDLDELLSDY